MRGWCSLLSVFISTEMRQKESDITDFIGSGDTSVERTGSETVDGDGCVCVWVCVCVCGCVCVVVALLEF
jgi:hypothetical protein